MLAITYGPVHSRRLGMSLGVNILPADTKLCSFDCIYCERGWNPDITSANLPSVKDIHDALGGKLQKLSDKKISIDYITFSGNGEPTLHPQFLRIMQDTIKLRNKICPNAKIAVLTNGTQAAQPDVEKALLSADSAIVKLDSAVDVTAHLINKPSGNYSVAEQIARYKKLAHKCIIQTLLLTGTIDGQTVDNTTEAEIKAYLRAVQEIQPQSVMLYCIDRQTPCTSLNKVSLETMQAVAKRLEAEGIKTTTAG